MRVGLVAGMRLASVLGKGGIGSPMVRVVRVHPPTARSGTTETSRSTRSAQTLHPWKWCEQRPAKVRPQHGVRLRRRWRHQVREISLGGRYCFLCASGASRGRGMRFREGGGVYAGRAEQQSSSKAVELGVAQRVVRCGARCSVPRHRRVQRCEPAPKSEV